MANDSPMVTIALSDLARLYDQAGEDRTEIRTTLVGPIALGDPALTGAGFQAGVAEGVRRSLAELGYVHAATAQRNETGVRQCQDHLATFLRTLEPVRDSGQ